MRFQDWKKLPARRKAISPADMKCYMAPQHKVTISIDSDLAKWLVDEIVGRTSFTSDLEETITTVLRVMRGELPPMYLPNRQNFDAERQRSLKG